MGKAEWRGKTLPGDDLTMTIIGKRYQVFVSLMASSTAPELHGSTAPGTEASTSGACGPPPCQAGGADTEGVVKRSLAKQGGRLPVKRRKGLAVVVQALPVQGGSVAETLVEDHGGNRGQGGPEEKSDKGNLRESFTDWHLKRRLPLSRKGPDGVLIPETSEWLPEGWTYTSCGK